MNYFEDRVMCLLYFVIIDEVDLILIDEVCMLLIIFGEVEKLMLFYI